MSKRWRDETGDRDDAGDAEEEEVVVGDDDDLPPPLPSSTSRGAKRFRTGPPPVAPASRPRAARAAMLRLLDEAATAADDDMAPQPMGRGGGGGAPRLASRRVPFRIREGQTSVDFPGIPGTQGPAPPPAPGDPDDPYGIGNDLALRRDYYPAGDGWVRGYDDYALYPGQERQTRLNRLHQAFHRMLLDKVEKSDAWQFMARVAYYTKAPITAFIDRGETDELVRIGAIAAAERKQKLESISKGIDQLETDKATVERSLLRTTREYAYMSEKIVAPANALLEGNGMESWVRLTGSSLADVPAICAGLLMPYYWRWQYRYVLSEVLADGAEDRAPSKELFDRVQRILEEDELLFPLDARTVLAPLTTRMQSRVLAGLDGVAVPGRNSANWRLATGLYFVERDVRMRGPRAVVAPGGPAAPPTFIPETRRGESLTAIAYQGQWLTAVLLHAAQHAFEALPWSEPGPAPGAVSPGPFVASRTDNSVLHDLGTGAPRNEAMLAWPSYLTSGENTSPHPVIGWANVPQVTDPNRPPPLSAPATVPADVKGIVGASIVYKSDKDVMPWIPISLLSRFLSPFVALDRFPVVDNDVTMGVASLSSIPAQLGSEYAVHTDNSILSMSGVYDAAAAAAASIAAPKIAGGDAALLCRRLRAELLKPDRLLGPFRTVRGSTQVAERPWTALYPSLAAYDAICAALDGLMSPVLLAFADAFCLSEETEKKLGSDALPLFGFALPTQSEMLVPTDADFRQLGNRKFTERDRRSMMAGTWYELLVSFSDVLEQPLSARGAVPNTGKVLYKVPTDINIVDDMREFRAYRDVTRFSASRFRAGIADNQSKEVDAAGDGNARTSSEFYAATLLPGFTTLFGQALARQLRPEAGFGAQHILDIPPPPPQAGGGGGGGASGIVRYPLDFITQVRRGRPLADAEEEARRELFYADVNRSRATLAGEINIEAGELDAYLRLTLSDDSIFAAAGEPEAAIRLRHAGAKGLPGGWPTAKPDSDALFARGLADPKVQQELHARFRWWQTALGTPWPTIAYLVDVVCRWIFSRARGKWQTRIAQTRTSIADLERRIRDRVSYDVTAANLIDVVRRESVPLEMDLSRPEIAGYFTGDFIGMLAAGMAFVRRWFGGGGSGNGEDVITQDELTSPSLWPVLADAFALYLKFTDAWIRLSHQDQYTTQEQHRHAPYNRDDAARALIAAIRQHIASGRKPQTAAAATSAVVTSAGLPSSPLQALGWVSR